MTTDTERALRLQIELLKGRNALLKLELAKANKAIKRLRKGRENWLEAMSKAININRALQMQVQKQPISIANAHQISALLYKLRPDEGAANYEATQEMLSFIEAVIRTNS